MSSTIFASKKRKQNIANLEKDDSDVDDDFADESDANKDGEGSDSEEPEDESDGFETADNFQGKTFDISRTVNLESGDLADVLSEKDSPVLRKAVAKKTAAPVAAQKVLSKEDWEM
jgi:hypothetical protein